MRAPLILGVLARGLLLSTVLTQSAWAITPGQRSVLFGNPYKPVWQWNFASTSALPSDGSVVDNTPSLGGLVTDSTGTLTYKANNLLTYSNTFSNNAAWAKVGVSLSNANAVPDPFGGTTATTVTATNHNGWMYTGWYSTSGAPNGIVSFWLRRNSGSGILTSVLLSDTNGATQSYVLRLWSKNPTNTTCTDASAFVGSTTDGQYLIGGGPVMITSAAPGSTTGDSSVYASLTSLTWDYANADASPSRYVYACLVTTGAYTPAASKPISLTLSGPQN